MKWINVEEELPPVGETVICYRKIIVTGWYMDKYCPFEKKKKGWHCDWDGLSRSIFKRFPVTHWMPLPNPPKINK